MTRVCDLLVALGGRTESGATIFAKNSDRPPDERQFVESIPSRVESVTEATYISIPGADGPTRACVISRPEWGWGAEHGVNDRGVAIGNATIYTTLDPRPFPDALTGMDLVRLGVERADSARAALDVIVALIDEFGQGGSGHAPDRPRRPYWSSFLIADATEAWVLETSGPDRAFERVNGARAVSNRVTIAAFDDRRHRRQPVATLVDPRLDATREFLATGAVSVESVQRHLATHGQGVDGWDVCMHVEGVERTTASMVVEIPGAGRPVVRVAAGNPCSAEWHDIEW